MHGFLAILRKHILVEGRRKVFFALRTAGVACVAGCCLVAMVTVGLGGGTVTGGGGAVVFTFAVTQVIILIPFAAIAGAYTVSREREGRTLAILLASGFRPLAIVGGLAVGRWVPIAVGLLAGLPIALLLLLYGGITIEGLVGAYLITFATSILAVGISALISSLSASTLRAMVGSITFLFMIFLILPYVTRALPVLSHPALKWFSPLHAVGHLMNPFFEIKTILPKAMTWALTGILLVMLGAWATSRPDPWRDRARRRPRRSRPLSGNPLVWHEMRRGAGRASRALLWLILALVVLMGVGIAVAGNWRSMMMLPGMTATVIGYLIWVACLIYAIASFGDWKREGSLTNLLVTPLHTREIIRAKLFAVARRMLPFIIIYAGMSLLATSGSSAMTQPPGGGQAGATLFAIGSAVLNFFGGLVGLALTTYLGVLLSLGTGSTARALILTVGAQFFLYIALWSALILVAVVAFAVYMQIAPLLEMVPQLSIVTEKVLADIAPYALLVIPVAFMSVCKLLLCVLIWVIMVKDFDRCVGRCR